MRFALTLETPTGMEAPNTQPLYEDEVPCFSMDWVAGQPGLEALSLERPTSSSQTRVG
jgi:hypothetical protein